MLIAAADVDALLGQISNVLPWAKVQPAVQIGDTVQVRMIGARPYSARCRLDFSVDITIGRHVDGGVFALVQPLVGSRATRAVLRTAAPAAIVQALLGDRQ